VPAALLLRDVYEYKDFNMYPRCRSFGRHETFHPCDNSSETRPAWHFFRRGEGRRVTKVRWPTGCRLRHKRLTGGGVCRTAHYAQNI